MMKVFNLSIIALSLVTLSGCMTPIGKEEFTCKNLKKNGVCAGPRDIHQLTNNRESLENLTEEELFAQLSGESAFKHNHERDDNIELPTVYEPRDNSQHHEGNYQQAKTIPPLPAEQTVADPFKQWPNAQVPLAPEPLAVLEPPKVMRVLTFAWRDAEGMLHMPGYTYVEVQEKQWSVGSAANLRPSRVIPLDIRTKSQEQIRAEKERKRGLSPLEVGVQSMMGN